MPIRISARPGENPEKTVQRFKRAISKEGILKEIKKRRYFEKPSEKRRREAKERAKAIRKKVLKIAKAKMKTKRITSARAKTR